MDVKLVILDEMGNKLDLGDNEVRGVEHGTESATAAALACAS
jgi:hypothetical protein